MQVIRFHFFDARHGEVSRHAFAAILSKAPRFSGLLDVWVIDRELT